MRDEALGDVASPEEFNPAHVLIDGEWRPARQVSSFTTAAPRTGEVLSTIAVSGAEDLEDALVAAVRAFRELREAQPDKIAGLLVTLAGLIEQNAESLTTVAADETGLGIEPRLNSVELPRTANQLRQAAAAARSRQWRRPQISPADGIAAWRTPLNGPVLVLGPNNFPLAFNPVAGGDFAAAIATHHPVVALSNPGHPRTTAHLADLGRQAAERVGLDRATVQLIHAVPQDAGLTLAGDSRLAAIAYTGSRRAGLALKSAADTAGVPMYAELSAVNPVVVLPEAAHERGRDIASQLATSIMGSAGQLCTKPGILIVPGDVGDPVARGLARAIANSDPLVVLSQRIVIELADLSGRWTAAGARPLTDSEQPAAGSGNWVRPRLFEVTAEQFAEEPDLFGTEAFGPMALVVRWKDLDALLQVVGLLQPSLTGTLFTAASGRDEAMYATIQPMLAARVGRLLDNKVPTGVAVVPAMHHGGPFPSASHAGYTSVGIPESLIRFTGRQAFDNVPDAHLPAELQGSNPLQLMREVDGVPTTEPITWGNS